MKDFFRIKTLIITLGIIIVAILISAVLAFFDFKKLDLSYKIVHAASGGNVFGWAWSENIGWISFNCDHTDDGTPPPNNIDTCATSSYSVNVDSQTGNFSGHAWSYNVGWIDFAPAADLITYPSCGYPSAPCETVEHSVGQVTGWAKILGLGDNGWLSMNGTWNDGQGGSGPYGVSINSSGDFSGWAWNSGGIGWVSFNCLDTNSCATFNYKVSTTAAGIVNNPPTITFNQMTDPGNLSYNEACSLGALNTQLEWKFNDSDEDTESKYKIIFDSANHTLSELDSMTDGANASLPLVTGELNGIAESFWPTQNNAHNRIVSLSYNTLYYWWVKVWDNRGGVSAWTSGPSFTTYAHEFPTANFSLSPAKPSKGEEVTFGDISSCDSSTSCSSWVWTILDASEVNVTDLKNPIYKFNSSGSKSATLKVTDGDGYYCDKTQAVQVNVALPTWWETKK